MEAKWEEMKTMVLVTLVISTMVAMMMVMASQNPLLTPEPWELIACVVLIFVFPQVLLFVLSVMEWARQQRLEVDEARVSKIQAAEWNKLLRRRWYLRTQTKLATGAALHHVHLQERRWALRQAYQQFRNAYTDFVFLNDRRLDLERERWEAAHAMSLEFWAGDPDFSGDEIQDMAYDTAQRMLWDYSKH